MNPKRTEQKSRAKGEHIPQVQMISATLEGKGGLRFKRGDAVYSPKGRARSKLARAFALGALDDAIALAKEQGKNEIAPLSLSVACVLRVCAKDGLSRGQGAGSAMRKPQETAVIEEEITHARVRKKEIAATLQGPSIQTEARAQAAEEAHREMKRRGIRRPPTVDTIIARI